MDEKRTGRVGEIIDLIKDAVQIQLVSESVTINRAQSREIGVSIYRPSNVNPLNVTLQTVAGVKSLKVTATVVVDSTPIPTQSEPVDPPAAGSGFPIVTPHMTDLHVCAIYVLREDGTDASDLFSTCLPAQMTFQIGQGLVWSPVFNFKSTTTTGLLTIVFYNVYDGDRSNQSLINGSQAYLFNVN